MNNIKKVCYESCKYRVRSVDFPTYEHCELYNLRLTRFESLPMGIPYLVPLKYKIQGEPLKHSICVYVPSKETTIDK
jgi:hypothetical protein